MKQQNQNKTRYNSYDHLLYTIINVSISPFNYGYCNGYFNSISFRDIAVIYELNGEMLSTMQGLLTGCLSFMGGLGGFWTSILIKKFSRKQCLSILSIGIILSCILIMISDIRILFIARCLQGLISGMISSVTPLFIRQFSPIQISSSLGPWNQIGIVAGITFSFTFTFILSLFLPPSIYWRIVFIFPVIPSLIQLYNLKYRYPYETPKWLLMNNKQKQARKLLAVIYKQQYVNEVYDEINKLLNSQNKRITLYSQPISQQQYPNLSIVKQNNQQIVNSLSKTRKYEKQMEQINKPLISNSNQKRQLKTNKLALITAFHLTVSHQMVGMGVVVSYSGEVVGQIFPHIQKIFPIFVNSVAIFGSFLCILILKRTGRKNNLLYGTLFMGILLITLSICFSQIDYSNFVSASTAPKFLICIIFLLIRLVFTSTIGPVVWIYIAQIVQPDILPHTAMVNWLVVAFINTLFPIAKHWLNGNPQYIFLVYGSYTLMAYFINRIVLVQTQDKKQEDIIKQYQQKMEKIL